MGFTTVMLICMAFTDLLPLCASATVLIRFELGRGQGGEQIHCR